jgi:DNA-directed RNA polymerase subunit L
MNPKIDNIREEKNTLLFTLSGINVSLANAIRRTILSDIPQVVFRTSPYEKNQCTIFTNTTRFNNEIIKQRLACIPVHIKDFDNLPLKNYLLEIEMENDTDSMMYVTTENFKIKNVATNTYLSEKDTRSIFPPDDYTGFFIDLLRLRPRISEEIPGEKIHLVCKFDIGTAKEEGMYNVVSTCSYAFTQDQDKVEQILSKKMQEWRDEDKTKDEIEFESKNWRLLEAMRIVKPDSFDFAIETIGVFTNQELLVKACEVLIQGLKDLDSAFQTDDDSLVKIVKSENTLANSYDILLEKEDYTLGKILEYVLYTKFYEGVKSMTYCGFKKMHPHDDGSVIRIGYKEPIEKTGIKQNIVEALKEAIHIYEKCRIEISKIKN